MKNFGKKFSVTKRLRICLTTSLLIHFLIVFGFYFQQKIEERREQRLLSIEYKEEEKKKEEKKKEEKKEEKPKEEQPKINPQVATITMKQFLEQKNVEKIDEELMKKLEKLARPMDDQISDTKIDIDKMIDMHSNQAELDLDAYAEELDIGDMAVVRIGKGTSTEDLLAQDQVMFPKEALSLPAKVGLVAMGGFSGSKGGGGLENIDIGEASSADIGSQKNAMKEAMTQTNKKSQISDDNKKPTTEVEISKGLKDRLLSMVPPLYPEWAQQQCLGGTITISLNIDENGQMSGTPIVMNTTGYPEWDNGVIKFIKTNWKWSKKPGTTSAGTVTIRFLIGS